MPSPFSGTYNGLAFGVGTPLALTELTGINEMPPVRVADESKSGDHGLFAGIDYLGGRTVGLGFWILGNGLADYDAQCDQIQAAFAAQAVELPLMYYTGDSTRQFQINCRPRKMHIPRDIQRQGRSGYASIQLVAVDPRKYNAISFSLSTGLASQSGGMTFNAIFPLTFGTTGAGGTVTAINNGNFQTPLTFSISGPVANPIIDNLTTGASLLFNITLAGGDTLTISRAGTSTCSIVLNSTASRRNALITGSALLQQFGLPGGAPGPSAPGTAQQFRYRNNGAFTGSQLTISAADAWL